jgi:very-short-patch-repair endonuclease
MIYYNPKLKSTARRLRSNMTDSERLLWSRIRRKQLKSFQFYRQKVVGNYIVDFYCPSGKIIIEVDGSQHYEKEALRKDKIRDERLSRLGFEVLRFSNSDVMRNLDGVLLETWDKLPSSKSPRSPFARRRTCNTAISEFSNT